VNVSHILAALPVAGAARLRHWEHLLWAGPPGLAG
jgi:hypothetical protein